MTLILKTQKSRFGLTDQLRVIIKGAVNVAMNEVAYDNNCGSKTFLTDALATCTAIAFYGNDPGFSTAFTHMSSASTPIDDQRKEKILDQMLAYVLKTNPLKQVRMVISPSSIEEYHLVNYIQKWAIGKNIICNKLIKGGDSAVFNIDEHGYGLMVATSLNVHEIIKDGIYKKCSGTGIVIATSNNKTTDCSDSVEKDISLIVNKSTFFSYSKIITSESSHSFRDSPKRV